MSHINKFTGKTAIITGANKGIGKAIALKLAKNGCNISVLGRTIDRQSNMPGNSIFNVCEEIEKIGGKCMPCQTDISKLDQIKDAIEKTKREFGGIDILINNAGYIKFKNMVEMPMEDVQKLFQVNSRGSFMMSKYCIPHLQKDRRGGHIINISPPINLNPNVFINKIAYTTSKYMESLTVLGLSEELKKDNVAVNALWPKYAIFTESMASVAGKNCQPMCRKPEIMADACQVILGKDPSTFTGQFCVDEDILHANGVNSFDEYAYNKENSKAGKLIKVPYNL